LGRPCTSSTFAAFPAPPPFFFFWCIWD
jgi:hypothetical protein